MFAPMPTEKNDQRGQGEARSHVELAYRVAQIEEKPCHAGHRISQVWTTVRGMLPPIRNCRTLLGPTLNARTRGPDSTGSTGRA